MLVELMVATSAGLVVLLGVAYFMTSSSLLFAKNISTNLSHNSLRFSLDKMVQAVNVANGSVTLVTTAGAAVSNGTAAAGIVFDQFLGSPYVVTHPGGSGFSSSATSLSITRSTNASASPPLPQAGDVLLLSDEEATRLKVQSVTAGAIDATTLRQTISVTLQNGIGTALSWDASTLKTATLVRKVAFVVMPNGARNELRYYNTAEAIANFSTSTTYSVVTNNIGVDSSDATPFTLTTVNGRDMISMVLRVRAGQYANRLSTREANNFSTVERVSLLLMPKAS